MPRSCVRLSNLFNRFEKSRSFGASTISSQKRPRLGGSSVDMSAIVSKVPTIVTTQREQDFFDLCLRAADRAGQGTVIRVAGGWVRDKLLGQNNDDIDLAVDNVSGEAFGRHLNQHLAALKREGKGSGRISPTGVKVAVIKANPDQSKHLETATVKVNGLEIDITNLRTETYSDGSRIPEMQFGTAAEDAFRRDLTINALFYNLNALVVEDLTGRGLNDLNQGKVATPLPPFETFKDDPLRVLRAVRFAHRFRFELDPEIGLAASHPTIVEALVSKVSRERFGKEVEGMLKRWRSFPACVRCLHGMGLLPLLLTTDAVATTERARLRTAQQASLDELGASADTAAAAAAAAAASGDSGGVGGGGGEGLSWEASLGALDWLALICEERAVAFAEASKDGETLSESTAAASAAVAAAAAAAATPPSSAAAGKKGKKGKKDGGGAPMPLDADAIARSAMLGGVVLPFAGTKAFAGKKKGKAQSAAAVALLEGLKCKNKDCDDSAAIAEAQPHFAAIASRITRQGEQEQAGGGVDAKPLLPLRVELGLLLRDLKSLWRPALALATAVSLQAAAGPAPSSSPSSKSPLLVGDTSEAAAGVLEAYGAVAEAVVALGLGEVWSEKPLLGGNDLAKALELTPGPGLGRALKAQMLWQLEHPQGTAEACVTALLAQDKLQWRDESVVLTPHVSVFLPYVSK